MSNRYHRPVWPEWNWKEHDSKSLLFYSGRNLYGADGRIQHKGCEGSELPDILVKSNSYAYVEDILDASLSEHYAEWANSRNYHLLASEKGHISAVRYEGPHRRTSWIVGFDKWFDKNFPGPIEALQIMESTIDHLGVGSKPTPSSLGRESMRYIYEVHNIRRRYCLPLGCESYISNGFGGIMQSNFVGHTIPKVIQLDGSSKYLSVWDLHPDGTPLWCTGNWIYDYATFFAKVRVTIPYELPMGLFPVRAKDGSVIYPKMKGLYITHLWREKIEKLQDMGIKCQVIEGWAWPSLTRDNSEWKDWMFDKRISSPSKDIERMVKKIAVSTIGSFLRSRDNFCVVGPDRYSKETDYPVLSRGDPLDLWVHPERDTRSAIMAHWSAYSISAANDSLIDISYPVSSKGELVLLDVDSMFTKNVDEIQSQYNMKGSSIPYAGEWLWKIHHNFHILRHRMWVSDEEPSRYGSLLRRIS